MLKKIIMFLSGIFITSYSLMFIIIYLNLLKMGYNFLEYLKYVFTHFECLMIFIGIFLIIISLRKNEYFKIKW